MNSYEKIGWLDHVEDVATGEVIQEGTPVSQTNMNHMDEGIYQNREAVILHEAQIADAQKEIKVLKDATLNNMTNNVFLINFDSVNSVAITSGIYDPVARETLCLGSACTLKETSCILGNFFGELCPICEKCRDLSEDELVIMTASGLTLEGESVLVIEGHSSITGKPAKVKAHRLRLRVLRG